MNILLLRLECKWVDSKSILLLFSPFNNSSVSYWQIYQFGGGGRGEGSETVRNNYQMITSNFGAPIVQVSRIDIRIDTGSKDIPAQVQMVSARWIYRNMKSVTRVAPTKQVEIEQ